MSKARVLVAALSLSAAAFVGLVSSEGYEDKAMVPTQGDRPTVGFGSTFHADGTPVKLGESTTPVRALVLAQAHIAKDEEIFRGSLAGASLSQVEFDVYMDFVYQYGTNAWAGSSMRKHVLAGNYRQACDALLQWKRAAGYDCSTLVNGQPNKRCWGVWQRQLDRHARCVGAL
jgi:lysozyme